MKKLLLFLSLACAAFAQVSIDWADVDKTGSSLAHLATRSASDLNSGTLAVGRLPALTGGDVTSSAGSGTLTLGTSGVSAGTYGGSTQPFTFIFDAKGRATSITANTQAANTVFAGPASGAAAASAFRALVQADTQAATAANRNALSPRGGIAFNGSTAYARVALTGQTISTGDFAVTFVGTVPSSNPTSNMGWGFYMGPSNTANAGANACSLFIDTSGFLIVGKRSGADVFQNVTSAFNIVAAHAGKTVVFTLSRTSALWTISINGVSVATSASFASEAVDSTYLIANTQASVWGVWRCYSMSLYNLALSAADVQEIYELGGAVPDRYQFGTQVAKYTSNFSAGADSFSDSGGNTTITGNVDQDADSAGVPPSNDWVRFTKTTTSGMFIARGVSLVLGKAYKVRADVFVPAGSSLAYLIATPNTFSAAEQKTDLRPSTGVAITAGSTTAFVQQFTNSATNNTATLFLNGTNAAGTTNAAVTNGHSVYLKNVAVYQVGAVANLALDEGIGFEGLDSSTNQLHAVMTTTGVAHVAAKNRGVLRFTTTTSGNQQILGQQALPANARIMSWTINSSGTPTVSLGNASAGAQFVSGAVLVSGLNEVTLLTRFCSTNNLWVNSNSTATLQHTIYYEIVD